MFKEDLPFYDTFSFLKITYLVILAMKETITSYSSQGTQVQLAYVSREMCGAAGWLITLCL